MCIRNLNFFQLAFDWVANKVRPICCCKTNSTRSAMNGVVVAAAWLQILCNVQHGLHQCHNDNRYMNRSLTNLMHISGFTCILRCALGFRCTLYYIYMYTHINFSERFVPLFHRLKLSAWFLAARRIIFISFYSSVWLDYLFRACFARTSFLRCRTLPACVYVCHFFHALVCVYARRLCCWLLHDIIYDYRC